MIVLDRMLLGIDGMTVLDSLRVIGVVTPELLLTALLRVKARVDGLEAGAGDYLVKPFAFSELTVRLNALAQWPTGVAVETMLRVGPLNL